MNSTLTAGAVQGSTPRDGFAAACVRLAARLAGSVAAECRSRRELRGLSFMNDHLLRDIGLARVAGVQVVRLGVGIRA